jgi:hypothetical protein
MKRGPTSARARHSLVQLQGYCIATHCDAPTCGDEVSLRPALPVLCGLPHLPFANHGYTGNRKRFFS